MERILKNEIESQSQIVGLTANNIMQKIEYFNSLTKAIYYDDLIMNSLVKANTSFLQNSEINQLKDRVQSLIRSDEYILGVYLFIPDGHVVYWNDGYSKLVSIDAIDSNYLDAINSANGRGVLSTPRSELSSRIYHQTDKSIMYGRVIKNSTGKFESLALLIIDINLLCFDKIMNNTNFISDTSLLLVNQENYIVWINNNDIFPNVASDKAPAELANIDGSDIYKPIEISGKRYYCVPAEIAELSGMCIAVIPQKSINNRLSSVRIITLLIIATSFLCLLFIIRVLTRQFIWPIQKLSIFMNELKHEGPLRQKEQGIASEIQFLYSSFYSLNSRTYDLLQQLKIAAEKENQQQLKLLHAQLNPHFLYNTLDTIKWMAKCNRSQEISGMITSLAMILRYSIKNYTELVSFQEELEWLRNYIVIQRFRFENLFEIHYDIDDTLLSCMVPKFLFQPFIENSIIHGFSDINTGGNIYLKISQYKSDILIIIEDNGKGMNQSQIDLCLHGESTGLGIKSISEFISGKYHEPYGISIVSSVSMGTRVEIRFPKLS
jgi:two-component system, sensor histidine kinase YesM